jgi:hypothetical protein
LGEFCTRCDPHSGRRRAKRAKPGPPPRGLCAVGWKRDWQPAEGSGRISRAEPSAGSERDVSGRRFAVLCSPPNVSGAAGCTYRGRPSERHFDGRWR